MSLVEPPQDARGAARLAWARAASGRPSLQLQRASSDAGFRSYWRGAVAGEQATCIVMDSPPALEDVRPWLALQVVLQAGGVRVPRVHAKDADTGFVLLEDLGSQTFLDLINADNADALFDQALTQLLRLQALAPPPGLPSYDRPLLAAELALFDQWFLGRHLGLTLSDREADALRTVQRALVEAALAQPQLLVHRDFMPRNLMPSDGAAVVLDFQDAVRGPLAYDVLSLFKDAFLSWPESRVEQWVARYHQRAQEQGLPVPGFETFRRDLDFIGVHRHLKVLGIFARLHHRDDKPRYLADGRRFIA
ncbi:MAG: phosphotransferase, partial [Pseudoxanthomonas sp.]